MRKIVMACLVACTSTTYAGGVHWGYDGKEGPEAWGSLSPDFALCASGRNQSPINIQGALKTPHRKLVTHYTQEGKEIFNNGHTVQINFAPGNTLQLEDGTYEMKQVHFHAPSENHIAGKAFPLEAHFVHADSKGNLAVVGVMFQDGKENAALKALSAFLPDSEGAPSKLAVKLKPTQMMPSSMDYYRFAGSLTTPPCSEGVRWLVMKQPMTASKSQIEAFAKAMRHHNNRPVQPMNGRVVIQ